MDSGRGRLENKDSTVGAGVGVGTDPPSVVPDRDTVPPTLWSTSDAKNIFSCHPEISAVSFNDDRKILCIGTTQAQAKLIIWEICSQTMVNEMALGNGLR